MPKFWTKPEEAMLCEMHSTLTCAQIATQLGRTVGSVKMKIIGLGLRKNQYWSEAEIEHLKELIGTAPKLALIQQYRNWASYHGYSKRTNCAIWEKVKKIGKSRKVDKHCDWYSTRDVSDAIGCSADIASDWFNRYKNILKPIPRTNARQGGLMVRRERLRRFLMENPQIVDRYRATIELYWLVDLLGNK
ncbi:MAG: hypothetical protein ACRCZS_23790 [Chroococcidiopsis sp.]